MPPTTTPGLWPPRPACQGPVSRRAPFCARLRDQRTCDGPPVLHGLPLPAQREAGLCEERSSNTPEDDGSFVAVTCYDDVLLHSNAQQ